MTGLTSASKHFRLDRMVEVSPLQAHYGIYL
jgi:hypothetical protein